MKKDQKSKGIYILTIVLCVGIIIACAIIIIQPDFSKIFQNQKVREGSKSDKIPEKEIKIVTMEHAGDTISKEEVRLLAQKQCKELGEEVEPNSLEVFEIEKKGEKYYYITSARNSIEVNVKTGRITKINFTKVDE